MRKEVILKALNLRHTKSTLVIGIYRRERISFFMDGQIAEIIGNNKRLRKKLISIIKKRYDEYHTLLML